MEEDLQKLRDARIILESLTTIKDRVKSEMISPINFEISVLKFRIKNKD